VRIAYLTTDEVNQDLVIRMAEDCGATVYLLSPHDPPPDGRFDAVLCDWDYWPSHRRQEVLQELLTACAHGVVALHGYHLDEEYVEALQGHGIFAFHRLEPEILEFLVQRTGLIPGDVSAEIGPAEGLAAEEARKPSIR
jgi:hypothetical protein